MAKLVAWMSALAVAAVVLLQDVRWATDDPAVAAMAVVRVVAGVLALYLLAATVGAAVVAVLRLPVRVRFAPALVRRLVAGAIGGGLLLSPVSAAAATHERPVAEAPPMLRRADGPATAPVPAPTPAPAPVAPPPVGEVVAVAGDHLWGIAERALSARLGRPATDREIAPYWIAVVDANRDRLVTGDPDLIFPGQTFVVP
jgi:nucleoid-associated protein YgaU